jgi:hypothetical protein
MAEKVREENPQGRPEQWAEYGEIKQPQPKIEKIPYSLSPFLLIANQETLLMINSHYSKNHNF